MDALLLHEWIETQIEERRAPPVPGPGFGQVVQELARTINAIERGHGPVFGMFLSGAHSDLTGHARYGRDVLVEWRQRLFEVHGSDGAAIVETIAARCNVVLETPAVPAAAVQTGVTAVTDVLRDIASLAPVWQRADELLGDSDAIVVQLGDPDAARLDHLVNVSSKALGWELPASYIELLRTHNGLAAFEDDPPSRIERVAANELSEPMIWPVGPDHHMFEATPLEGISRGRAFAFGEIVGSGTLVLEAGGPAPVFWVPRRFSHDPVSRLADSFDEFLVKLANAALSVPILLRSAGVPGWG